MRKGLVAEKTDVETTDRISELVTAMKREGFDFSEEVAIFKWGLEEHPGLEFTLVIKLAEGKNLASQSVFTLQ